MKRVLLIDDDDDIREVASLALETGGDYEVLAAGSGAEGIAIARSRRPDVILLDVMMPGLDGPSTLQHLRALEETRGIPVVFLTAKVQAPERRRLESLGARGLIAKPFDPLTLASQVEELIG